MKIALIVLNDVGLGLARRLQPTLDGAVVHGLAGRADMADLVFHNTMTHLRALHRKGTPIVGLCAAGILILSLIHI